MKIGDRVEYVGDATPSLKGKRGRIVADEKWFCVDFGDGVGVAKCADVNLRPAEIEP